MNPAKAPASLMTQVEPPWFDAFLKLNFIQGRLFSNLYRPVAPCWLDAVARGAPDLEVQPLLSSVPREIFAPEWHEHLRGLCRPVAAHTMPGFPQSRRAKSGSRASELRPEAVASPYAKARNSTPSGCGIWPAFHRPFCLEISSCGDLFHLSRAVFRQNGFGLQSLAESQSA
jgi:hypothetical protein